MAMDPENFTRTWVTAELGGQGNGPVSDGTDAPVDGDDERHAFLIATKRTLLVLVKALQQVVLPAGLLLAVV